MPTESGCVTLLVADDSFEQSAFDESGLSNIYGGSTIETTLTSYTASGAFKDVAYAIRTVALSDVNNIEAKLYLLSTGEAKIVAEEVRKFSYDWWLRSPGDDVTYAAFVYGAVGDRGDYVLKPYVVRPALQLDLSSTHRNPKHFRLFQQKRMRVQRMILMIAPIPIQVTAA